MQYFFIVYNLFYEVPFQDNVIESDYVKQMASLIILTRILRTPLLKFQWGENLELMYDRVLRYPDRVRNLYFTFLFVLRAVTKVSIIA